MLHREHELRILYIAPFTATGDHFDSGIIGYGVTSGGAIVRELRRINHAVEVIPDRPHTTKLGHIYATYETLATRDLSSIDGILMYNTHHQHAAEIRRLLYERGYDQVLLAGYSHGSHWDPSDQVRHNYPLLRFADLGNVMAMDLVLLVSEYMLDVIYRTLADQLGAQAADEFRSRASVVGGTFDTERLDATRTPKEHAPHVIFNHSPTPAKRPQRFIRVAMLMMRRFPDLHVVVTRRFRDGDPGSTDLAELCRQFPRRVVLGDTFSIDDYFRWLWRSHIQVSTATHESFGVSTVEAIYAGCCSLLPVHGSYPEVSGRAGLYEDGQLCAALEHYLVDAEARRQTAAQQRESIRQYYPTEVARRIVDALTKVSGGAVRAKSER